MSSSIDNIDIIPDESFINDININTLTIKERITGHTLPCYSYTKHWSKSPNGPPTGYVLLTNETTNLSIIDIDINKSYIDEQRTTIRESHLSRLSTNDIIVQSTSGSLHIYTNTNDFPVYQNALIKCFKSEDFDIDIFSSINPSKQSFVVLPNSKVRPNHKSKINKYKFIQGSFDSIIERSLKDVLHSLNIKITITQIPEITKITNDNKQYNISNELAEALINGLSGLTIHNDGKGQTINDEINLYTLCQTINTLPTHLIKTAYEFIHEHCKLTLSAQANFETAISRYENCSTSPFVLVKIIRVWNNEYYIKHIKPLMKEYETQFHIIDLNDTFIFNNIRDKSENHEYTTDKQVIEDMSRCLRFIDDGKDMYIIKSFNNEGGTQQFAFVNDSYIMKQLKRINLWTEDNKTIKACDILINNMSKFVIRGVQFFSNNENVLSMFHGFKYKVVESVNISLIQPFLDLVHEVISNNDDFINEYILNWISYIVQHPGTKTGTALVLKGLQGIGKGTFTNILSELLAGYSAKNITDISELTGTFNSVIEGRMLIILNELKNCGDDRMSNFNALKSIITDDTIRINEKLQPRRTAQNLANFIFVSNNAFPVKIETGDRRYVVSFVNGKYKDDLNYFNHLDDVVNKEGFYDNLLSFFIKRDISTFKPQRIPMTEAKQDIIDASKSPVDTFICDHYRELIDGMLCDYALSLKPIDIREKTFAIQLKDRCIRKQKQIDGSRKWYYILKDECKSIYRPTSDDDNE